MVCRHLKSANACWQKSCSRWFLHRYNSPNKPKHTNLIWDYHILHKTEKCLHMFIEPWIQPMFKNQVSTVSLLLPVQSPDHDGRFLKSTDYPVTVLKPAGPKHCNKVTEHQH